jgi:serine protease inhibitor
MKKRLLNRKRLMQLLLSLCLILVSANISWGQQVIGSYPVMDGGFEGQTVAPLPLTAIAPAVNTTWAYGTSGTAAISSTVSGTTGPRTGSKYAVVSVNATAIGRQLISPSATTTITSGSYVVQYYTRNATASMNGIPVGIGTVGNSYAGDGKNTTTTWNKVAQVVTSSATDLTSSVVAFRTKLSASQTSGGFDVDDVVIYAGSSADILPPVAASVGAVSGLNVSWTASSDIDGGGYMVVRYSTIPQPDNDPNANGIYAEGNTITSGVVPLTGTVVYIGTGTSFTDAVVGSVSGSDYYKIYTVDKAFNYATEIVATAVVSSTPAITSSIETLTGFTYTGVGPSASQSFLVSGSNLTNNLVVSTTSTDFELSADNFATAGVSSITLTTPTVASTTLYVRLKANLLGGSKSATVTIASTGANTLPNISLSGSVQAVYYYNGSGLVSSNTSWGVNTDGSGTNPAAVTATYTNFVITNGSVTTDAVWILGANSKLIVGNGSAVTLTVADTFPITGTIDATATGSVVWKDLLSSPTFGTLNNDSEVHFQPAANASYGLGNGTAYGKLFIDGAGKVSVLAGATNSTATVKNALTVALGSTLDFPPTNTHSVTINAGASATIDGTVRAGKQGGLFGSTIDTPAATTTTVSILFVGTPNLTLAASSTIDYYRPNAAQTVSALPSGVNYANLTLTETGCTAITSKVIPTTGITVNGTLTISLAGVAFASTTVNADKITLANGATIVRTLGALNAAPLYIGTYNVIYNGTTVQTTDFELPTSSSVLNNLTINNAAGVTLGANTTVNGALALTAGVVTTGANILSVAATGSTSRTNGWVNGNLKCAIASGANTYLYPLGNATKYTPASIDFISAGSGDLTVNTVDGASGNYPVSLNASNKLARFWNFTTAGIGTFNANITFNYDATDLVGAATSSSITAYKYDSTSTYSYPITTTGTNSFTVTGITSFSEFGAGDCVVVTPTFIQVSAICTGDTLAALPTTSDNGITGTWSPAIDNTTTTIYTFTPTTGVCVTIATMTITVNPNVIPTFTPVAAICSGDTLAVLPTTSDNGITGTWSPNLDNTTTATYTFTPSAGQCATTTTMTITVNSNVTPTFTQVAAICSGDTLAALPTTSNNSITGTWSPAIDNTATTTYTFTPTTGVCATTTPMTITVNSNVIPTFTQVAAICSGATLAALPTTSNNSITGTWSPAIDNTATTTYTFTPITGICITTATMTITVNVNPNVIPTFTQVTAICSGGTLAALPTTSNNSITGTWSPAIDNTATTTYTFTPTAGQCATTTTMTITVNPNVTPTFTQVAAICSGDTLAALPTTSDNGITGTWSPAIDNTATTIYTFTPITGVCATIAIMTITVNPNVTPTFTQVAAICSGGTLAALPNTSDNGITGTWSPAIDNTATTTYIFTPVTGQCATTTTMTITVNSTPAPTGALAQSIASNLTIASISVTGTAIVWYASAENAASGTDPLPNTTALSNTTYYATQTIDGCASTLSLAVTVTTTLANVEFESVKFNYYPNPIIDQLLITADKEINSIEVYNLIGQKLISLNPNVSQISIDFLNLPKAVYLVKLNANGVSKDIKVIKK